MLHHHYECFQPLICLLMYISYHPGADPPPAPPHLRTRHHHLLVHHRHHNHHHDHHQQLSIDIIIIAIIIDMIVVSIIDMIIVVPISTTVFIITMAALDKNANTYNPKSRSKAGPSSHLRPALEVGGVCLSSRMLDIRSN